ncbi:MAG: PLP-dependent aminotransferase family protein [Dehalococcoidia bacterium]|nr:PLP-dependent aminotransferase family protein [Chloroflexi bacterium CFX7]MCK6565726.1 PLP-dependent aminotransferase family protein [Dehalococcoidia bacterium]NUQ54512.1 PLP-dependent aminotransferase family protein [Dehalococcoidia bacterium]
MPETPYWNSERIEEVVSARAKVLGPAVWAAATPDPRPVISFAGGLPDIPSLPGSLLLKAAETVIDREQKEALEYGGTFGPLPLRTAIAERSSRLEGVSVSLEQVIVSSGSAHAIGMVCETLLDPGDTVLVESPNFPGSMRTIRSFGARQVAIPMDEYGLRTDVLEDELQKLSDQGLRAKFIYCIPTHQNPAGCTLDMQRREKMVELARRFNTFILEDDAYGELWFTEKPPPSLFALTNGDHAIKVSSFSKILATGLRMGWALGPEALISRMASVRYDMGSSPFLGRVIAETIRNGDLDRHIVRLREIYKRKLDRVEEALGRYCADYCSWATPQGGFFLWLELRAGLHSRDVALAANQKGVLVGQGPGFFADGVATNHVRLAFSYVAMEDVEEGIHRLGEAMADVAAGRAAK